MKMNNDIKDSMNLAKLQERCIKQEDLIQAMDSFFKVEKNCRETGDYQPLNIARSKVKGMLDTHYGRTLRGKGW